MKKKTSKAWILDKWWKKAIFVFALADIGYFLISMIFILIGAFI